MKKTYCIVASQYLPHMGGVERYTYNLAKEMTRKGHEVIIITSEYDGKENFEKTDEATVVRLPSLKLLDGRFPIVLYNKQTRNLLNKVREYKIDYVIINTRFYLLSYIGACFGKKLHVPTIVIEHGTGHFTVNNPFFDFCGHIYEHIITGLIKNKVRYFYGVSMECCKWLQHFKIESRGVFYNSIDINNISNLLENESDYIKDIIEYDEKDIIITYTGRLVKEKGVLKLIDAINSLDKKFVNLKLCIAGEGPLYEDIAQFNNKRIYLLGKLEFQNVVQLLKLSTIYCLPTDYPEGLPTSVLEAMAAKVYVITTTKGGAKEIINSQKYGTILQDNTADNISNAISSILSDTANRKNAVENAYNRVCNQFTWECTVNKIVSELNQL